MPKAVNKSAICNQVSSKRVPSNLSSFADIKILKAVNILYALRCLSIMPAFVKLLIRSSRCDASIALVPSPPSPCGVLIYGPEDCSLVGLSTERWDTQDIP